MTIGKGTAWGQPAEVPNSIRVVPSDRAAHSWVTEHRQQGKPITDLGISGGDLARTAGGGVSGRFPGTAVYAPFDALRVVLDGQLTTWAVAHVIARRSWLSGELLMAMNAQFFGEYDVAPRAHPNDGLVDVLRVAGGMSARARLAARGRARHGGHLPHPDLTMMRRAAVTTTFTRPLVVWVDGERIGTATSLEVTVEPDAFHAYV